MQLQNKILPWRASEQKGFGCFFVIIFATWFNLLGCTYNIKGFRSSTINKNKKALYKSIGYRMKRFFFADRMQVHSRKRCFLKSQPYHN